MSKEFNNMFDELVERTGEILRQTGVKDRLPPRRYKGVDIGNDMRMFLAW